MDDDYRQPSAAELAILSKLLESDFPGRGRLSEQLHGLQVKTIDEEGSLSLRVAPHLVPADLQKRIVAEGYYTDADASPADLLHVHVLLHVVDGFLAEMEIYKDDGSAIIKPPAAEDLILEP